MSALEPTRSVHGSPRRSRLLPTAGGALLLTLGLACLVFLGFNLVKDLSLWLLGRTLSGQVVDQWVERLDDRQQGELTFRYLIRYRYTTPNGQTFTKESTLSSLEWSGLTEGSPVSVIYFPLKPEHARLEDRRYAMVYLCGYLPFGLMGWVAMRAGWNVIRSTSTGSENDSMSTPWKSHSDRIGR
ncbi:DUF3592 domain-containing protein [Chloroflexota bacterium]